LIGQHDLGGPKTVLVGILSEPYLKALDRLGLDVSLRAGLGIKDDDIEAASGEASDLLLGCEYEWNGKLGSCITSL
jgi:hypothetical protein